MSGTLSHLHPGDVLLRRFRLAGDSGPAAESLQARLCHCAAQLEESHLRLAGLPREPGPQGPAAESLVDHHLAVREQVQTSLRELRGVREERLPVLDDAMNGPIKGTVNSRLPRVYHLACGLVDGADQKLDAAGLREFVNAYQRRCVLTRTELWALPAMLRLALIEKLGGLAARTAFRREGRDERAVGGKPLGEDPPCASDRVSIGRAIASLRALGNIDWKEIIESTSLVERTLRQDPAGVYARMTFESRNHYHEVVAMLARNSALTEVQIAESAVACAARSPAPSAAPDPRTDDSPDAAARHVGYFLLGRGLPELEKEIGYRPPRAARVRRSVARHAAAWHFGGIFAAWLLAATLAAAAGWRMGILDSAGPLGGLVLFLLAAGGLGHLVVALVDWLGSFFTAPQPMMRMDFSAGIPADCRTLVAVPTMLTSEQGVSTLLHQLELRFLANRDENLSFVLLTDFPDADRETLPDDSKLVSAASQGIERLNRRHRNAFYLLHRPRVWNEQEGAWMGSERKRGKLAAMNRLLRSGDASEFQATVGDLARLASVRFVITLDTDTRLPRDVARELAGCMAHPLNRPRIDARTRMVTEGHAVLQPRVSTTCVDAQRSLFSRLLAGDAGIDPYTHQVSHLYQDLFDQGSFIGKGIYDVRAWEAAWRDDSRKTAS